MFKSISIIGDGGMGTVLGMLLCEKGLAARIWGYDREQLAQIATRRENKKFLPGHILPQTLAFEPDDGRIMSGTDLVVSAVPCQFMRSVWNRLRPAFLLAQESSGPAGIPIVSVAKGIENDTLLRPTQILAEILAPAPTGLPSTSSGPEPVEGAGAGGGSCARQPVGAGLAVLSGPTIADELARKLPATACAAAHDEILAKHVQRTFSVPWLRVYTNTDVVGVELAGAMKNVIAIAAGIIDGTGAGDNAKAALLTRGLAEISRLGVAMGAMPQTFSGLTGLGDLVTTCISPSGRNRSFGERIGKGQSIEQAQRVNESVVEGIATCKSVVALARQYDIEVPITQGVYGVLFENKPVQKAIADLMTRRLKAE